MLGISVTSPLTRYKNLNLAILVFVSSVYHVTADATPVGIYWADSGTGEIQKANLDGTGVQTLVSSLSNPQALFATGDHIYWTDRDDLQIKRSDLDGNNVDTVLTSAPAAPRDLFVGNDYMYFTTTGDDSISRANLDGSDSVELVSIGHLFPTGIALHGDGLYWADSGLTSIKRGNIDGSGVIELVSGLGSTYLPSDVFVTDEYLYWTTRDLALTRGGIAAAGTIQRAYLDGSNVITLVDDLLFPQQLVVTSDYIYWSDQESGKIQRSNLDGTDVVDLVVGLTAPVGLAVVTAGVPEPASIILIVLGIAVFGIVRRKKRDLYPRMPSTRCCNQIMGTDPFF